MTRTRKLLAFSLAVLILFSVTFIGTTATSAALAEISYTFTSDAPGYAQGTITLTPSQDNFGTYHLYFADDNAALSGPKINVSMPAPPFLYYNIS